MRTLIVLSVLAIAMPVSAQAPKTEPGGPPPTGGNVTFEAKAAGAQRIKRIEDVVWALTATCDQGDDTQQRQCRRVRDTRAAQLAGATLIVDADKDAFAISPWSAQKKSASLTLSACIRCAGVEISGKTYFVVANKEGNPPPKFDGGKLSVGQLHDNARTFPDENAAKAFAKGAANARVQMIVKVPAKPTWTIAGKHGLSFDMLGYRVFSPCDGSVVCASPKSGPGEVDKKQCGPVSSGAGGDDTKLDQLTPAVITHTMKPVVEAAKECFKKFAVAGKAKLKIAVASDGSVMSYEQQGDFANTPTGKCIDVAMKQVSFPRSRREKTPISYPIKLP